MSKIITVKPGDTLSKISRVEYGTATKYMLIFSAHCSSSSVPFYYYY